MGVRRAISGDARGIAEVHVRAWQDAYRGLIPDAYLDALRQEQRLPLWQRVLVDPAQDVFVAEDPNGAIVGFASVGRSRDEDAAADTGEVSSLYLLASHWSRGYGRALMAAVLGAARARGFRCLTLWVLEGNQRARRFYAAAGFTPDGAEQDDIRPDGVVLRECRYRLEL